MKKLLLIFLGTFLLSFTGFSQTVEFSDDFESGTDNWVLEGTWGLTTAQSNSPSNSLTESPGGNYAADLDISATMAEGVDLSSALDAELNFSAIYDIEGGNFDYMYVEASGDGGTTWVNIATFLGEGNLDPWTAYNYSLGGFVGNEDVRIRFRFSSDGGYEVDGMYIDDVEIVSSNEDNSAPLILHTPNTHYRSNIGDVTKTADLIDVSGIATANLHYSVSGGDYVTVAGVNTSDDSYSFLIPGQTPGTAVDYYIETSDASANANAVSTDTFSYIDGNHIYYDNEIVDFVNSFGPDGISGSGCAVRFTLVGTTDIVYALIRNYTDFDSPNDDFEFHIWADNNGVPGDDLITPFMVTPEANLDVTSPMTRVDLTPYMDELSGLTGDVFVGFTVPEGQVWVVQSTPGPAGRTYTFDGTNWALDTGDDYHFRLVTTPFYSADECTAATDLNPLMGQGIDNVQTSPIWNNSDATTDDNDPTEGWDCFGEPDGGGSTPSLENTLWYTFTGDGEAYRIRTSDCGGVLSDYIDDGDTQIAIYEGTDCGNLTPVACNEDQDGTPAEGPYPAGLILETTPGTTYYMMVDGFGGADGEFCVEITQLAYVTCAEINMGAAEGTADICFNDATEFSVADVVIPLSPQSGFLWVVTSEDISGSEDPFNEASFQGNFAISPEVYTPNLANDGTQLPSGTYYFTPIVFGGAVDTDGTLAGFDFSGGCVLTGNSVTVNLLGELDPITLTYTTVSVTNPPGGNGEATVVASGGSGNYTYSWSIGADTETITDLFAATYSVTVSDATGCIEDATIEVVVDIATGVDNNELSQSIDLYPNPAGDFVNLEYDLDNAADLNIRITNAIGKQVFIENLAGAQKGVQQLNLHALSNGVYIVVISDGVNQTVKRLVKQ